jgi:hypothetical protein
MSAWLLGSDLMSSIRNKIVFNMVKDKYHNINNPRGRYAHLKNIDSVHPFSEEAFIS